MLFDRLPRKSLKTFVCLLDYHGLMGAIKEYTDIAEKLNDFFAFVFTTEDAG